MPDLIRFLIRHALAGGMIGVAFTAGVLVFDLGQIRTMTEGTMTGFGVRMLLFFFVSSTFASLQMGIAVMAPPSRKDDPTAPPGEDEDDKTR